MPPSRRVFLQSAAAAAVSASSLVNAAESTPPPAVTKEQLDKILDTPVLKTDFLKEPVTIASIELLKNGKTFLVRARSTAGVEAIAVPNSDRLANVYPFFLNQIVPVFLNQDARNLEK